MKGIIGRKEQKTMKRAFIVAVVILVLAGSMFAGVVKKTKSDVTFKGFGKFSSIQSEKLTAEQNWTNSKSDFKGQGIVGSLAGKALLRSGDTGEIIDLVAMSIYHLDHKKKEYTVSPIKKLTEEMAGGRPKAKVETQERGEQPESDIKITRSEFKVEDTGETATINNFPCRKYSVTWIMEWENTKTGEKGSNRLVSLVWTTPETGTLQAAREEESKFSRAYLEKIGINVEQMQQDVLGTNWLTLLNTMNPTKAKASPDVSKFASEMKKIQGFPVVTDGKYYVTGQKPATETAEKEQEEQPKNVKGLFGGLAKKALKKKTVEKEGGAEEPALAFYTEVTEISLADLSKSDFQVPAGYNKKD
jgi:hypothetical protein